MLKDISVDHCVKVCTERQEWTRCVHFGNWNECLFASYSQCSAAEVHWHNALQFISVSSLCAVCATHSIWPYL